MTAQLRLVTPTPAPKPHDPARLLRDMDELAKAEAKVAALKQRVAEGCRRWSFANGFCVVVRPEAVRRAIEGAGL